MAKLKRTQLAAEARRRNLEQLSRLGAQIREGRLRRRLTQARLGRLVGLTQPTISEIERGNGGSHTADTLQRVALAVDRTLRLELPRDPLEEPVDAAHLAIQELVLKIGRAVGYVGRFELSTSRRSDRSADAGLIDRRRHLALLCECVNTLTDFGAAVRASHRKRRELEDFATAHGQGWTVGLCWIVRDVRRNRELLVRYPEVFATEFPGSSTAWVDALTKGTLPPQAAGLIWCDASATRLFARRLTPPVSGRPSRRSSGLSGRVAGR